jgi:hypothetical protein
MSLFKRFQGMTACPEDGGIQLLLLFYSAQNKKLFELS